MLRFSVERPKRSRHPIERTVTNLSNQDDLNYSTRPLSDAAMNLGVLICPKGAITFSFTIHDLFASQPKEQAFVFPFFSINASPIDTKPQQGNPTLTHPNVSDSSSSFPLFPPDAHQSTCLKRSRQTSPSTQKIPSRGFGRVSVPKIRTSDFLYANFFYYVRAILLRTFSHSRYPLQFQLPPPTPPEP